MRTVAGSGGGCARSAGTREFLSFSFEGGWLVVGGAAWLQRQRRPRCLGSLPDRADGTSGRAGVRFVSGTRGGRARVERTRKRFSISSWGAGQRGGLGGGGSGSRGTCRGGRGKVIAVNCCYIR